MVRPHRTQLAAVVAAAASLLAPAAGRVAADPPARPFRGTAVGQVTAQTETGLVIEYTGTATHLGRFTRVEHLTFTGPGTFVGTMAFTAADGDELYLDFAGAFVSPTTATGTYTFTGGTGRFEGAAGQASFEAFTPDGAHVTAAFTGTIRY